MARGDEEEEGFQGTDKKWYERLFDIPKPGFSIGGLFGMVIWAGIIATIGFFVLKAFPNLADKIPDEWKIGIEGLVNKIGLSLFPNVLEEMPASSPDPENKNNARSLLTRHGVDPAMAAVLTENQETWQGFIRLVKAANGGKANQDTLMSDKTITSLLLNDTPLATRLIAAIPARSAAPAPTGGSTAAPTPPPANNTKLLNALKRIVGNTDTLNQILTRDDTRLLVAQALVKLTPANAVGFKPGSEQALADFIKVVGMNNGAGVTPEFAAFLNAAMSGDTAAITPYLTNAMVSQPAATSALLAAIDPATVTDDNLKRMLTTATDTQVQGAIATLSGAAGQDATAAFIRAATSNDPAQAQVVIDYVLKPEVLQNPAALQALASSIDLSTIPATNSSMRNMVQLLQFNAGPVTQLLRDLGPRATEFMDVLKTGDENKIGDFVAKTENISIFKAFADNPALQMNKLPEGTIRSRVAALHNASPQQVEDAAAIAESGFNRAGVINIFQKRNEQGRPVIRPNGDPVFDLTRTINNLMVPGNRSYLREQIALLPVPQANRLLHSINPALNLQNVTTLLNFMDQLNANPRNWDTAAHQQRTRAVLTAVVDMFTETDPNKKMDKFKALSPETVSGFFGVEGNRRAFYNVILNLRGLPERETTIIKVLQEHWLMQSGRGFSQVLADTRGAEFVLKSLKGENSAEWFDVLVTPILRDNRDHLTAMADALKALDAPAPATRSRTAAGTGEPDVVAPRTPVRAAGLAAGPTLRAAH